MNQGLSTVAIDLAKKVFHLVGVDTTGKILWRKRLSRNTSMPFIAQLPRVLIGIEAYGGTPDWARRFREHDREVKLMAPQFVTPFVKSNKNDMRDTEAIAEAVTRDDACCRTKGRKRSDNGCDGGRSPRSSSIQVVSNQDRSRNRTRIEQCRPHAGCEFQEQVSQAAAPMP